MKTYALKDIKAQHELLRSDPHAYVDSITRTIAADPDDSHAYFDRHLGWLALNRRDLALADLDRAIAMRPHPMGYLARGRILAKLGRHEMALADFASGERLAPTEWPTMWGPLHQAISLAALGQEQAAVAACGRLSADFWLPEMDGEPGGSKAQITAEIRRRARAARSA